MTYYDGYTITVLLDGSCLMADDDLGGEVILGDPPEDEEGGPDVDTDDVEAS